MDALRVSRNFDRVECVLELADVDPDVLTETRSFLISLTKQRGIDETPAALSEGAESLADSILRCLELAADKGRVAMVTQQSWMFLRSFADLRAPEEPDSSFKGLLRETTIEALAHLGPGAFGAISGEVVNIVLFSLTKAVPGSDHRLTAFRLIGPKSPEEKDRLLRQALNSLRDEADSSIYADIVASPPLQR